MNFRLFIETTEGDFLASLWYEPNDTAILALADWLEETGKDIQLAAYIRTKMETLRKKVKDHKDWHDRSATLRADLYRTRLDNLGQWKVVYTRPSGAREEMWFTKTESNVKELIRLNFSTKQIYWYKLSFSADTATLMTANNKKLFDIPNDRGNFPNAPLLSAKMGWQTIHRRLSYLSPNQVNRPTDPDLYPTTNSSHMEEMKVSFNDLPQEIMPGLMLGLVDWYANMYRAPLPNEIMAGVFVYMYQPREGRWVMRRRANQESRDVLVSVARRELDTIAGNYFGSTRLDYVAAAVVIVEGQNRWRLSKLMWLDYIHTYQQDRITVHESKRTVTHQDFALAAQELNREWKWIRLYDNFDLSHPQTLENLIKSGQKPE